MKNLTHEEIDFLISLRAMDNLFWNFSNLEKITNQDLSTLSAKELYSLHKKYSKLLTSDRLKETISSLVDYRIICINESIAASLPLYEQMERNGGWICHYSPPETIHTFRFSNFETYGGTVSEHRFYSRKPKKLNKSIHHTTNKIAEIKANYNGWIHSNINIPNCLESLEADNYLEKSENTIKANSSIRKIADNFIKLTKLYHIKNNYLIFTDYSGKKFSVDFQKQDVLSEDEFTCKW